ncbi:uncharacterized protein OGAPODRAFT_95527 [Ogataea polymorpha]|uniref:uncharacterized protein n=1 Tax=Ogataea polymorpha TaxID=460523 RepID=UPI0007F3A4B4|nr:uncharacterized protein OGAPODRAFT_95527 [Ogataea polymorpha]OBA14495.1 hypothetical protein OGAPODRAFT_95527 [Ogataea polymorpha]
MVQRWHVCVGGGSTQRRQAAGDQKRTGRPAGHAFQGRCFRVCRKCAGQADANIFQVQVCRQCAPDRFQGGRLRDPVIFWCRLDNGWLVITIVFLRRE